MSIDILQEKIRKLKNPSVVELMLPLAALPPRYAHDAKGYGEFCRDLLGGLKGIIPAVRLSFGYFALLGGDGLQELAQTLNAARNMGYYTVLDAPELLSPIRPPDNGGSVFRRGKPTIPVTGWSFPDTWAAISSSPSCPGAGRGRRICSWQRVPATNLPRNCRTCSAAPGWCIRWLWT